MIFDTISKKNNVMKYLKLIFFTTLFSLFSLNDYLFSQDHRYDEYEYNPSQFRFCQDQECEDIYSKATLIRDSLIINKLLGKIDSFLVAETDKPFKNLKILNSYFYYTNLENQNLRYYDDITVDLELNISNTNDIIVSYWIKFKFNKNHTFSQFSNNDTRFIEDGLTLNSNELKSALINNRNLFNLNPSDFDKIISHMDNNTITLEFHDGFLIEGNTIKLIIDYIPGIRKREIVFNFKKSNKYFENIIYYKVYSINRGGTPSY